MSMHNWQHHLTRPMTIFSASLWHEWYASPFITELIGVAPAPEALFVEQPKGTAAYFFEDNQLNLLNASIEQIVLEAPQRMEEILTNGLALMDEARARIARYPAGDETLQSAAEFQVRLGLLTANLPRLTLNFIEKHQLTAPQLIAPAEKLRLQTIYPEYTAKVATLLAVRVLEARGVKNVEQKINLATYSEISRNNLIEFDQRLQLRTEGKLFVYQAGEQGEQITLSSTNTPLLEQLFGFSGATKEIKGTVAYPGKVTGRARIVLDMDADFSDGDILVSINSTPELMPFIVKCSAIVTDEGGLGCHAAIISRELHKPCIIGTKIATQVLKDGDMVEVDAEKGVIRRLGR